MNSKQCPKMALNRSRAKDNKFAIKCALTKKIFFIKFESANSQLTLPIMVTISGLHKLN